MIDVTGWDPQHAPGRHPHGEWRPKVLQVSASQGSAPSLEWLLDDLFDVRAHHSTPFAAINSLRNGPIDILFLVVGHQWTSQLPGCLVIRAASSIPIAVIGERSTLEKRIKFFEAGADDVFDVDQVDPAELIHRTYAIVHRYRRGSPSSIVRGPAGLTANLTEREVVAGDAHAPLTTGEAELLAVLLEAQGHVMPLGSIAERLSGVPFDGRRNSVEKLVSQLRRKLRRVGRPEALETVRGVGYRITGVALATAGSGGPEKWGSLPDA